MSVVMPMPNSRRRPCHGDGGDEKDEEAEAEEEGFHGGILYLKVGNAVRGVECVFVVVNLM